MVSSSLSKLTIGVIIPTYNRALLISDAVDSLLAQTRLPDQIIVVDDGSTDNTLEVLERYAQESRITIIAQPNRGRSAARNVALRVLNTDLVAFLDSDDTLPSNSLSQRAIIFESHPETMVVYSDVLLIDMQGQEIGSFSRYRPGLRHSGMMFGELAFHNLTPIHAYLLRRHLIEEVGFFDESLHTLEDYDFWLRIAACYPFYYVNELLANYRIHVQMTTLEQTHLMRSNEIEVQCRAVELPAFVQLSAFEQTRIWVSIGAKYAVMGELKEARTWLFKAFKRMPFYFKIYPYFMFTLLGKNGVRAVAVLRRKILGRIKTVTYWSYPLRNTHPEN